MLDVHLGMAHFVPPFSSFFMAVVEGMEEEKREEMMKNVAKHVMDKVRL